MVPAGTVVSVLSPFGGVTAYGFLDQGEGGYNAAAIDLVPTKQGEILDRRIIESLGLVVDRIPHQRFAGGGIPGSNSRPH